MRGGDGRIAPGQEERRTNEGSVNIIVLDSV